METFSALLAICAGNSPVPGEFPTQRPMTRSSDVFFDLRLNIRLSKQSWGWWFDTLSCPLWRQCNGKLVMCCFETPAVLKHALKYPDIISFNFTQYSYLWLDLQVQHIPRAGSSDAGFPPGRTLQCRHMRGMGSLKKSRFRITVHF